MGLCPTPCDDDCQAACHELHQVTWKRTHTPESHATPGHAEVDDDEFDLPGEEPPDPPDED